MGWSVRRSQTWHHRCRGRSLRQVHTGDVLYVIEKFDFEVALDNAKATILNREADLAVKKAQNARRAALTTLSTSIEGKQVFDGNAKMAEAAYASAKAALSQAEINLQRTEVRSPVDGYVTNLLMRMGDFARAGTPNLSAIRWRRRCRASKLRSAEDREHHGWHQGCERGKQGLPNVDPISHLGSTCATNSGANQDRTSPSGGIARCRNDL